MSDYASQLTEIYNKLGAIQATLSKLALLSRINTISVRSFFILLTSCNLFYDHSIINKQNSQVACHATFSDP